MCDKFVGDVFKALNSRAGKKLPEPRERLKGNKLQSASFFVLFFLFPSLFCEVEHQFLFLCLSSSFLSPFFLKSKHTESFIFRSKHTSLKKCIANGLSAPATMWLDASGPSSSTIIAWSSCESLSTSMSAACSFSCSSPSSTGPAGAGGGDGDGRGDGEAEGAGGGDGAVGGDGAGEGPGGGSGDRCCSRSRSGGLTAEGVL